MRKLIALTAALLVAAAWAIEPPKPQTPPKAGTQPPPRTAEPAPAKPADTAPAEPEVEEELPPLPPDTVPAGPPPARFTPTEKVRADFPVSFPIDI